MDFSIKKQKGTEKKYRAPASLAENGAQRLKGWLANKRRI
jgi:hypothetical protein